MSKKIFGYQFRSILPEEEGYFDVPEGSLICTRRDDATMFFLPTGEIKEFPFGGGECLWTPSNPN